MSQENVEIVKRMLDAFVAGDFELALEVLNEGSYGTAPLVALTRVASSAIVG